MQRSINNVCEAPFRYIPHFINNIQAGIRQKQDICYTTYVKHFSGTFTFYKQSYNRNATGMQQLQSVNRSVLQSVTLIFVPGHAGVRAMDQADILNSIQGNGRAEDSRKDKESTSVLACSNLGVKCGTARFECHAGHL